MQIRREPMTAVLEHWECGECGGEMLATGFCYPTLPAQYPHACSKCGRVENSMSGMFPRIAHLPVEA